jgi:hypothetical protein
MKNSANNQEGRISIVIQGFYRICQFTTFTIFDTVKLTKLKGLLEIKPNFETSKLRNCPKTLESMETRVWPGPGPMYTHTGNGLLPPDPRPGAARPRVGAVLLPVLLFVSAGFVSAKCSSNTANSFAYVGTNAWTDDRANGTDDGTDGTDVWANAWANAGTITGTAASSTHDETSSNASTKPISRTRRTATAFRCNEKERRLSPASFYFFFSQTHARPWHDFFFPCSTTERLVLLGLCCLPI